MFEISNLTVILTVIAIVTGAAAFLYNAVTKLSNHIDRSIAATNLRLDAERQSSDLASARFEMKRQAADDRFEASQARFDAIQQELMNSNTRFDAVHQELMGFHGRLVKQEVKEE